MSIYLTALVQAKADSIQEVKILLTNLVKNSRTETACLQYDLHQSADDEKVFIFHEEWQDQEGLNLHNTQPYILDFVKKSTELLASPVTIYKTKKTIID